MGEWEAEVHTRTVAIERLRGRNTRILLLLLLLLLLIIIIIIIIINIRSQNGLLMCDFCWCCDETFRTPGSLDDVKMRVCVKLQAVN